MRIYPLSTYNFRRSSNSDIYSSTDEKIFYISSKFLDDNLQANPALRDNVVNAHDKNGQNICHSMDANKAKILDEKLGRDFLYLLKQKDNDGNTPMHALASKFDVMSYLIKDSKLDKKELKSLLFEKNNQGQVPLHLASADVSMLILNHFEKDSVTLAKMLIQKDNEGKRVIDPKYGIVSRSNSLKAQKISMIANNLSKEHDVPSNIRADLSIIYEKEFEQIGKLGTRKFIKGTYIKLPEHNASSKKL